MPLFRIFRMKDSPRQQFRWAPHVSGTANAKPKDFEERGQLEALHEYDAWRILREQGVCRHSSGVAARGGLTGVASPVSLQ